MDVEINDKDLLKLYATGKSRKYKIPEEVKEKFLLRANLIMNAVDIYDIWKDPAAKFKKLSGEESAYSMRLNKRYRLEMEVYWENDEKKVGKFVLTKISKHYE